MKNKELERHEKVLNRINSASKKEELPSIGYSSILQIISDVMCFNNNKLDKDTFKVVIDKLNSGYSFRSNEIRRSIMIILLNNYSDLNEKEVTDKYIELINNEKINNILYEVQLRTEKIRIFENEEKKKNHETNVKNINNSVIVRELPRVGLSELNKELLSCVNNNDFVKNIKTCEISELTEAYLNKESFDYIKVVVGNMVHKFNIPVTSKSKMKEQIIAALILNINIDYIIEEIELKEKRKEYIYKADHEDVMKQINLANTIYKLPGNLSESTLNGYLAGNSTIYTNDNRIPSTEFKRLTSLLLSGNKIDDEISKEEIKSLVTKYYPDKNDAFDLLYNKLRELPRTYYYVDEIVAFLNKRAQLILYSNTYSNLYLKLYLKNKNGGRFFVIHSNQGDNYNFDEIVSKFNKSKYPQEPLNYEIKEDDLNDLLKFARENYDSTFKRVGAIILSLGEKLRNINIYIPEVSQVYVDNKEKEKMDSISDLDKEIKEKEELLKLLNDKINNSKNEYNDLNNKIDSIISEYEEKAIKLQQEMMNSINDLKSNYQKTKKL